jgi:hypothetical protein
MSWRAGCAISLSVVVAFESISAVRPSRRQPRDALSRQASPLGRGGRGQRRPLPGVVLVRRDARAPPPPLLGAQPHLARPPTSAFLRPLGVAVPPAHASRLVADRECRPRRKAAAAQLLRRRSLQPIPRNPLPFLLPRRRQQRNGLTCSLEHACDFCRAIASRGRDAERGQRPRASVNVRGSSRFVVRRGA